MNSKFTREFQDTLPDWNKILRRFTKRNETVDSNEIPEEMDPKIVNGRPANEGEFPWMVALHFNNRFICSSFLISPTIVMTAAHCVQFNNGVEPATAFYGIIGNIRREGPETRIQFREVAAHPQYGSGSEYDIAVFRVSSTVEMTDFIQTICLPESGRSFDLVYVQAMGWGVTSNNNQDPPETMMTTELSVPPRTACQFFYALLGITITDRHICVNSFRPTGVCYGDSGGPAVYDDPLSGKPVAVGVASFISFLGCGRPIAPSVYTRIASYIDWLTETVGDTNDICFV
ncbi:Transmembrane protease serine 11B like protein [Argiope bruennichi]|uniref:Transmembrane protease serine 11B like protein n=2 Tax=Argiope bruennichi TaxID=94029 RepID=A0A8T0E0L0_ARGBR|nr:Transmembrane protease serine 11B like protein [Argiope bruennichi]